MSVLCQRAPCKRAPCQRAPCPDPGQRGLVLLVALVVLLVMSLGALALVRMSGLGAGVAGNLAFKQAATHGGDLGLEHGRALLGRLYDQADTVLESDDEAQGYYASVQAAQAVKSFPWDGGSLLVTQDDGLGHRVRAIVHRLCSSAGPWNADGQQCVLPQGGDCPGSSDTAGSVTGCQARPTYRITARVDGPRATVSYVQMTVY